MKSPYAGVGRRAVATLIDGFLLTPIVIVIIIMFSESGSLFIREDGIATQLDFNGMSLLMLIAFSAFYWIGMELTFCATVGKLVTGLRVRNADGAPVSIRGALMRFLFQWFDGLFCYLVAAIFVKATSKNQRFGDILGGTVVVYRDAIFVPTAPPTLSPVSWQS